MLHTGFSRGGSKTVHAVIGAFGERGLCRILSAQERDIKKNVPKTAHSIERTVVMTSTLTFGVRVPGSVAKKINPMRSSLRQGRGRRKTRPKLTERMVQGTADNTSQRSIPGARAYASQDLRDFRDRHDVTPKRLLTLRVFEEGLLLSPAYRFRGASQTSRAALLPRRGFRPCTLCGRASGPVRSPSRLIVVYLLFGFLFCSHVGL